MSNLEKLDNCKKEIRSILIPFKDGCYLSEFNRTYRNLIGKRLPAAEFGFRTDIEFLYSMPDVAKITPAGRNEYHLLGVADEKVKHIQKMVSRQKTSSKLKGPPLPRYVRASTSSNLPPRFLRNKSVPEFTWSQKIVPKEHKVHPAETVNNNTELPTKESKLSPKEEVLLLVQKHKNKLALDDLLVEYKRMYNKNLSLSTYGLSTIEECIDCIPELDIIIVNNVEFIVHRSELQTTSNNKVQNSYEATSDLNTFRIPTPEMPPAFNSDSTRNENYYEGNVPNSLRKKFQQVADKSPNGIWASDFPDYFEEVTSETLDFSSLGYRCLADLIDDVPDIFIRKPLAGSRKDYIICPAKSEIDDSSVFVDHIILNFRKILEGYPEGIKIREILHVYSINFKDTLHIEDLGFDNLETFLSSLKNSVPLRFGFIDGEKSVHLGIMKDLYREPEICIDEPIPFDALIPEFVKFNPLTMPFDFDDTKFVPVYVSAVAHPGRLYIQFKQEGSYGFEELSKRMECFYNGSQSENYMLKSIHVKEGGSCVAKWPTDNHWYRALILSVSTLKAVKVFYVDYGTIDTIPIHLLRYVTQKFMDLPIQALQCKLSYLRPPKNAAKWPLQARNRILSLCEDVALMAKFEIQSGGIYSIILCDTNGEDDVYINDVLCEEGLAECDSPVSEETDAVSPVSEETNAVSPEPKVQMEPLHNLNSLHALQAQYFLKAFATVAPSFAQNEHYLILLQEISKYCQTPDLMQQNIGMPIMAPVGPPGFNPITPNLKACGNSNPLGNSHPVSSPLEGSSFKPKTNVNPSFERDTYTSPKLAENANFGNDETDNENFDDDDEIFQQFYQKVISSNMRYVKRVTLGDGYKIHIIVKDSIPYASSGDISQLIWNNKEADYLFRRLEFKEEDIPYITLSEDGYEELFQQLKKFNVKGVQTITGFKSSIVLFALKNAIKILNIFGHPSITLRTRLTEEITTFNASDPYWQHFPSDSVESDDDDKATGVTDDDKIERLCLYDLLAMKESITCKKKKILNNQSSSQSEEIYKLEQLQKKVLKRIQEIKEICEEFN